MPVLKQPQAILKDGKGSLWVLLAEECEVSEFINIALQNCQTKVKRTYCSWGTRQISVVLITKLVSILSAKKKEKVIGINYLLLFVDNGFTKQTKEKEIPWFSLEKYDEACCRYTRFYFCSFPNGKNMNTPKLKQNLLIFS